MRKADILFSLLHDKIDRAVLAANPKLRAVASMSITPDNIDVEEATRRGIAVTVVPPVVTEATADIHFGLMIAVARRMVEGDTLVRAGAISRLAVATISSAPRSPARPSASSAPAASARRRRGARTASA